MHFANLLLLASSATAISLPNFPDISQIFARQNTNKCPAVWSQISKELTAKFLTDGQCNPTARAAIRAVFHDCGGKSSSLGNLISLLKLNSVEHRTGRNWWMRWKSDPFR